MALVQWLEPHLTFAEAVGQLTGSQVPSSPKAATTRRKPDLKSKPPTAQPGNWRKEAAALVAKAHEKLWDSEPAMAYLESRGLEPHTWLAYGLGFRHDAPLPGTKGEQRAPAIVLPWRSRAGVYAIRYRFLELQSYTDSEGRERSEKLVAETGSTFAGKLFGGQALPDFLYMPAPEGHRHIERLRCLLIVEGEINAMSCWQVAGETLLDTLSLGSESAKLTEEAVTFAQRYGRVLVWADKGQIAQQLMQAVPGAYGVQSPGGRDANDLLRAGLLGGFLAMVRADAAKSKSEREALLWALWDSAGTLKGVDTRTAKVAMSLAAELGRQIELVEAEPNRWLTAEFLRG